MTIPDINEETQQLSLRLPAGLYRSTRVYAKKRKLSVNALVRSLLEDLERHEKEAALKSAYELLGENDDAAVNNMFEAQAEVARRG
mgnify:CR=1 FL=1